MTFQMKRLSPLLILFLATCAGTSSHQLEQLSLRTNYSWVSDGRYELLQVVLSIINTGRQKIDIPGQFLWNINYIPNANSVKRMESKVDSVKQFADSVRAAGGKYLHFRDDGPGYPRLMNFQVPQDDARLKLSVGEVVRDTLLFDARRGSYREWPGILRVDWQFGPAWQPEQAIPLDSLRLEVPVP